MTEFDRVHSEVVISDKIWEVYAMHRRVAVITKGKVFYNCDMLNGMGGTVLRAIGTSPHDALITALDELNVEWRPC